MSILESSSPDSVPTQLAGRGRRLVAFLLDAVIFAIGPLLDVVLRTAGQPSVGNALRLLWTVAVLAVQVWLLATRGQTIGKILLQMAIVDVDTKLPPGFLRASVIRQGFQGLLGQLYPLAFLAFIVVDSLFIFTPTRRCLHDRFARTEVIAVDRDWR